MAMREVSQPVEQQEPERTRPDREATRKGPAVSNAALMDALRSPALDGPSLGGTPPPSAPPTPSPTYATARSATRRALGADAGAPPPDAPADDPAVVDAIAALGPLPAPRVPQPPAAALRDVHGWCRALAGLPSEAAEAAALPAALALHPEGDAADTALRRLALASAATARLDAAGRRSLERLAALGIDGKDPAGALAARWPSGPGRAVEGLRRRVWAGWVQRLADIGQDEACDPPDGVDEVVARLVAPMGPWPGDGTLAAPLLHALRDPTRAAALVADAEAAGDALVATAAGRLQGTAPVDLVPLAWRLGGAAALGLLARIGAG